MSNKENWKEILEACRKKGPMDEKLLRGSTESSEEKDDGYYANAMSGKKYLQFSSDEDEGKD